MKRRKQREREIGKGERRGRENERVMGRLKGEKTEKRREDGHSQFEM